MFGEDGQCGAMLGLVAMWWVEVEGQKSEVYCLFFIIFGLTLGEMHLVAIPVGVSVD